jgi:SulP family sulfate permease
LFVPKSIVCLRDYSWSQFRADLGAGVVVGLVALPLAMAFAIASGVPPERGLYTAIVAGFLISLLGGSRVQIGGPTGAFVVIVAGIVAKFGYNGLVLATLMAGVLLLIMGFARLGSVVKFIPYPVTTGFTSGIAVIIFSSQVKDIFGLPLASVPAEFLEKWAAYGQVLARFNPWALGIAAFTAGLIALWPKSWKLPASIVALTLSAAAVGIWRLPVETIASRFGGVPSSLPHLSLPDFSAAQMRLLLPSAVTVALLAAIESLLSAVVADGMINGRHKSNLELVAQGAANLASPLFGGIPATGAIARTATNVKNGGRTPVAGMVHALTLALILLAAGSLAAKIPLAALAGVLVVVCWHMSEWRSFKALLSGPKNDVLVLLITFLLTVLVDLTVAVEVGMVLAAFLFMKSMADLTQVKSLKREFSNGDVGTTETRPEPLRTARVPPDVEVYAVQGTFFFGAASKLMETIRTVEKKPRALVLEMKEVLQMDATGLHVLEQIKADCSRLGMRLMLSGIHSQPLFVLQQAGKYKDFGEENLAPDLASALKVLASKTARPAKASRRPKDLGKAG